MVLYFSVMREPQNQQSLLVIIKAGELLVLASYFIA